MKSKTIERIELLVMRLHDFVDTFQDTPFANESQRYRAAELKTACSNLEAVLVLEKGDDI